MNADRKRRHARRRLRGEKCEPRFCLSVVTFAAHDIVATDAYRPGAVHAADLDGDGDLDVLSASQDDKIAWYENTDGKGNYAPQQVISQYADGANDVRTADLDGDGDLDVLSTSSNDNKIAWYENTDGKGDFAPQRVISTLADQPNSVRAADLDGDGDLDLVSSSLGGGIAWYENRDGKGSFSLPREISTAVERARSVAAADVDGDGDLDVLSASSNDGKIAWYENVNGQGSFGPQQVISIADGVRDVAAGDVDGDGDLDVIQASGDDTIGWYENTDGQGSFAAQQVIATAAPGTVISLYVGDLDGDRDLDVLSGVWGQGGEIAWYRNTDGSGTFQKQQVILTQEDGAWSVYAGDVDGDGDLDVLSATLSDSKIAWYENADSLGGYGPQKSITSEKYRAYSVQSGDLDGDGDLDVVAALLTDGIAWNENTDGQGNFGPLKMITTGLVRAVYLSDMDGDGDLDVLSALPDDDTIAWYENADGKGSFGPSQVITTAADGALSVFAADADGDGDLDVFSASRWDRKVAWYENTDGQGTFGSQRVITTNANQVNSVRADDLDGDGDLDVLAAGDSEIAWYQNTDGKGSFGPARVFTTQSHGSNSLATGDLDGDGDLDVLAASDLVHREVAWYENTDGLGTFGSPQVIDTVPNSNPRSAQAADLDGDGDLDVVAATWLRDGGVAWYENTDGRGTFGPQQQIATPADGILNVSTGDLDGDGDLDVLSASDGAMVVGWYENAQWEFYPGDANRDGRFDSGDLVQVFQIGEYEDEIENNSTWEDGDWNGDGDFDSSDLVLAFQLGRYEAESPAIDARWAAAVDSLFARASRANRPSSFVA